MSKKSVNIIGVICILLFIRLNLEAKEEVQIVLKTGHTDIVRTAAFSPDGKYIISAGDDKKVRLWETNTGKQIRVFEGHDARVSSVAFSPDGKYIASGSGSWIQPDCTIRLWETDTGKQIRIFEGHTDSVNSVAFSPHGKYIVSGSGSESDRDHTVRLWETNTGQQVRTFKGHKGSVNSVAFSPDGKYIAAASSDGILLWEKNTGKKIRRLKGDKIIVHSLAFSPDGKYIASTAGLDLVVRLWETDTGKQIRVFEVPDYGFRTVAFTPDGKNIICGYGVDDAIVWETDTGKKIKDLQSGFEDLSTDGRYFIDISGSSIHLFETDTGNRIKVFEGGVSYPVNSVAFSPDGRYIVSGGEDKKVRLWETNTGKQIRIFEWDIADSVNSVAFSPDGKYIASRGVYGIICLWETNTGKQIRVFEREKKYEIAYGMSIAFSPDGEYIVSGGSLGLSEDGKGIVRLLEIDAGKQLKVFQEADGPVAFSPDGKYIAHINGSKISRRDHTVRLREIDTGKQIRIFKGHKTYIKSIAFSPDGKYIVSGSGSELERVGAVRLWETDTGQQVRIFKGHKESVNSVAFSPDGKYIASGSHDRTVRLWETDTGKQIRIFEGHVNSVNSVAFSPDGRYIVSGSEDASLKLWCSDTGELLVSLVGCEDKEWVAYTPNNYYNSSPKGDQYVGFKTKDKTSRFEQYAEIFKRPGIISSLIKGDDTKEAVVAIEKETGVQVSSVGVDEIPPPEVVIQYLKVGKTPIEPVDQVVDFPEIVIVAKAIERKHGVEKIEIELNGIIVFEKKGLRHREYSIEAPINLRDKENMIAIRAYSRKKVKSYRREINITYKEELLKGKTLPELVEYHFGKSKSWAVVIGINKYSKEKGWEPLPYAVNDAKALKDHLIKYLGFTEDHIFSPYNATKAEIESLLGDELPRKVKENDRVLIFFSGHGDTRPTRRGELGYLVPVDGDEKSPHASYISMDQLYTFSDLIPAKQIIFIIDACYSGIRGAIFRKGKQEEETREQVEIFIKSGGRQLLTAGTSDERVAMSERWERHSVYTYYLIEGLKGAADYNSDKVISVRELQVYLDSTVPKEARQHPQMFDLGTGGGQFIFYREGEL